MNKFIDTRFVTFQEDYQIKTRDGGKRTIYKKGQKYAIHVNNVKVLESRDVKMKVEKPNWEELREKRAKINKQKKKSNIIYE